jgi:FkbM family methyltransferase
MRYLTFLKKLGFTPKYFYDIGCSEKRWSIVVPFIFQGIRCYTFDANKDYRAEFPVCLSNVNDKDVKFYIYSNTVGSYYKINNPPEDYIDELKTIKLDTLVQNEKLEYPDLVKINCCGCDKDIIEGGIETIKKCKYLIVTLNNNNPFEGAPTAAETGEYIKSIGFDFKSALDNNGMGLIDYVFVNKNI